MSDRGENSGMKGQHQHYVSVDILSNHNTHFNSNQSLRRSNTLIYQRNMTRGSDMSGPGYVIPSSPANSSLCKRKNAVPYVLFSNRSVIQFIPEAINGKKAWYQKVGNFIIPYDVRRPGHCKWRKT